MIGNLQLLRGLAALGVVFYHTDFRLAGDWHTEFFGVSTFFVISGFIMCFITRDDADGFLTKRAIRIVPLYWVCTLIVLLHQMPITTHIGLFWTWASTNAPHFLQSLLFMPADRFPLLGVGWTLNFEIYFYVVFAAALMISGRLAPLIAWAIVYAVIKANDLGADNFLIKFYSHGYISYFLYGIGLFYVWSFAKDYAPKWPTIVGCIAIVIVGYGSQFVTPLWLDIPAAQYCVPCIPVALVGTALFSASSGADIKWRPLTLIGDASYAIYLTHPIFFELVRRFLPPLKENVVAMLIIVVGAALVGIAVHLWIERPLGRLVRSLVSKNGLLPTTIAGQNLESPVELDAAAR